MKGPRAEIDLTAMLHRHLKIFGSTLRTRPAAEKAQIVAALLKQFGTALEQAVFVRRFTKRSLHPRPQPRIA